MSYQPIEKQYLFSSDQNKEWLSFGNIEGNICTEYSLGGRYSYRIFHCGEISLLFPAIYSVKIPEG